MITIKPIELGVIRGNAGQTAEDMIGLLNKSLAKLVPDPEKYEIEATIHFDEENGVYVASGTASHVKHERQSLYVGAVAGNTISEIKSKAKSMAEDLFGDTDVEVTYRDIFSMTGFELGVHGTGSVYASQVSVTVK